jgi:bifunctional non-homologous end joining protein LigD
VEIQKAKVVRSRRKGGGDSNAVPRSKKKFLEELLRRCPRASISFVEPMQCKLVDRLPTAGKWLYELKLDGFRALAIKSGNRVELISRNRKVLSARYPELAESVGRLSCKRLVLDGEIVALDKRGWPSFQILQNLGADDERHLFFYAFDILNFEGRDLRGLEIEDRKAVLQSIGLGPEPRVQVITAVEADSSVLLEVVEKHALEGIIAKKAGSLYEAGQRSGTWIKYKNLQQQEFVIGGYTEPEGTRQAFGALLVGYYDDNEQLRFASKVGTGFTAALLSKLWKQFQPLRQKTCPFVNLPETSSGRWGQGLTRAQMKTVTWLNPKLVCEIGFTEWTEGDHLRHPAFKGMREDKEAEDVRRERTSL